MHVSSSYAKILGETNCQSREFPRSASKAKDGGEKRKEKEKKVGNNNCQLRIATPPRVAHPKPPGPILERSSLIKISGKLFYDLGEPFKYMMLQKNLGAFWKNWYSAYLVSTTFHFILKENLYTH